VWAGSSHLVHQCPCVRGTLHFGPHTHAETASCLLQRCFSKFALQLLHWIFAFLNILYCPNYSRIWVLKIPLDVQKTTKQRFRGPFPEPKGAQTFRRQVKHFLGCKKSTKSNTGGFLFTCSGPYFFHRRNLDCKITEPMHFWICVHFVPRFDRTWNATDDPPLTICRMATSTEKRQKVCLFQRFFHPSMSIFPRFPTFPALSNFY